MIANSSGGGGGTAKSTSSSPAPSGFAPLSASESGGYCRAGALERAGGANGRAGPAGFTRAGEEGITGRAAEAGRPIFDAGAAGAAGRDGQPCDGTGAGAIGAAARAGPAGRAGRVPVALAPACEITDAPEAGGRTVAGVTGFAERAWGGVAADCETGLGTGAARPGPGAGRGADGIAETGGPAGGFALNCA